MSGHPDASRGSFDYSDPLHLQLLLDVSPSPLTRRQYLYNRYTKRVLGFGAALLGLVVLAPFFALIALLIYRESGGPVFFRQERVGKDGRLFRIVKFRTMRTDAPAHVSTTEWKESDSYITRIGAVLRRTSIDELPQLWNVLRGEMALVGPRPLIVREADMDYLRRQNGVYQLRPGITGWAQVTGRDFVDVRDKISMDCHYLAFLSLRLDLKLIGKTVRGVFRRDSVAF